MTISVLSQGLLVACLLGLLQTMTEDHYRQLWDLHHQHGAVTSSQQLHHLLHNFMLLLSTLVTPAKRVFPRDWFLMHMVTNHILLLTMQEIAKPILLYFSNRNAFDYQVKRIGSSNYFTCLISQHPFQFPFFILFNILFNFLFNFLFSSFSTSFSISC